MINFLFKNLVKSDVELDCDPLYEDTDGKLLNPCGLIANSFFNGNFYCLPFYYNLTLS